MKTARNFIALAILAAIAWGCQPQSTVDPASNGPELDEFFGSGPDRPSSICGSAVTKDIENDTRDVLGEVEIVNDQSDLYFIVGMYHDWVITKLDLFVGKSTNIPTSQGGDVDVEAFPYHFNAGRPVNDRNFKIPLSSISNLGGCYSVSIHAEIAQVDLFGSVYNQKDVWLYGSRLGNGYFIDHCTQGCSVVPGAPGGNTGSSN